MKPRKTDDETLANAIDVPAREIQSGDGVANAAIAEAAQRLRELKTQRDTLWSLADGAKVLVELMHTTPIEVYNREVWKPNWLKTFKMVSDEIHNRGRDA
jgi:hypothetical protein